MKLSLNTAQIRELDVSESKLVSGDFALGTGITQEYLM